MQTTSERFLLAGATFGPGSASDSQWLQIVLVLTVHRWSAPICVGGLQVSRVNHFIQKVTPMTLFGVSIIVVSY